VGLKLKRTRQPLAYDDVNLLEDNTDTINKNKGTTIDVSKQVDLEIQAEKSKYTLLSRHQNTRENDKQIAE
jgi:hypothetical protein